ncbi:hypothetical protein ACLOJK_029924 [Asimina triloba]
MVQNNRFSLSKSHCIRYFREPERVCLVAGVCMQALSGSCMYEEVQCKICRRMQTTGPAAASDDCCNHFMDPVVMDVSVALQSTCRLLLPQRRASCAFVGMIYRPDVASPEGGPHWDSAHSFTWKD